MTGGTNRLYCWSCFIDLCVLLDVAVRKGDECVDRFLLPFDVDVKLRHLTGVFANPLSHAICSQDKNLVKISDLSKCTRFWVEIKLAIGRDFNQQGPNPVEDLLRAKDPVSWNVENFVKIP